TNEGGGAAGDDVLRSGDNPFELAIAGLVPGFGSAGDLLTDCLLVRRFVCFLTIEDREERETWSAASRGTLRGFI
ncbi:hypothetical protein, partial [Pseudorhizobium endolithicum]|uniref:hypothetical protein n=1 Tax=Pseudorhizobium endolithicum TaxID=1191678 RepID=UPI00163CF83A